MLYFQSLNFAPLTSHYEREPLTAYTLHLTPRSCDSEHGVTRNTELIKYYLPLTPYTSPLTEARTPHTSHLTPHLFGRGNSAALQELHKIQINNKDLVKRSETTEIFRWLCFD